MTDTTLRIRLTRLAGRHSSPGSDAAIDAELAAIPDWLASDEAALADMKRLAEREDRKDKTND